MKMHEDILDLERIRWRNLAQRIAHGDAGARAEFLDRYTVTVRSLIARTLGLAGLDELVEETMEGVLSGVAAGQLIDSRQFLAFVRMTVARRLVVRACPPPPADRERLRPLAARIKRTLAGLEAPERDALLAVYTQGMTIEAAEVRFRLAPGTLSALRSRFVAEVKEKPRKPPLTETRTSLTRQAAAGA